MCDRARVCLHVPALCRLGRDPGRDRGLKRARRRPPCEHHGRPGGHADSAPVRHGIPGPEAADETASLSTPGPRRSRPTRPVRGRRERLSISRRARGGWPQREIGRARGLDYPHAQRPRDPIEPRASSGRGPGCPPQKNSPTHRGGPHEHTSPGGGGGPRNLGPALNSHDVVHTPRRSLSRAPQRYCRKHPTSTGRTVIPVAQGRRSGRLLDAADVDERGGAQASASVERT